MGFSRQEYWSGLPCPPPGSNPCLLRLLQWQVGSLPLAPFKKPTFLTCKHGIISNPSSKALSTPLAPWSPCSVLLLQWILATPKTVASWHPLSWGTVPSPPPRHIGNDSPGRLLTYPTGRLWIASSREIQNYPHQGGSRLYPPGD